VSDSSSATAQATHRPSRARPGSLTLATRAYFAVAVVFLALALLVAIALPYGEYDAMAFGVWSRLIGEHWPTFHFAQAYPGAYQRPVFFVLQGLLWHVFGFHQWLGRLLSLAFSVLLAATVAVLAGRIAPRYRGLAAALSIVVLLTVSYFDRYVAAGLTDVPVAAMIGLTAVLLYARRLGRAQLPLVGVAAALAILTKPSALAALIGLGAAVVIGPRNGLRGRLYALLAIGLGTVAALAYDLSQARYFHMGFWSFFTLGSGGFWAQLAGQTRRQVLLDGAWLGPDLRIFLWFGFVYAVARIVGSRHRPAVLVAFPISAVWSWLGPHLSGAHGLRVGILGTGGTTEQLAVLVLAASLLFALAAPDDAVPDRLQLARLLLWALPTLVVFGREATYTLRLLSPAWPPLVLLVTCTLLPAYAGARRRSEWLVAVPACALLTLVVLATYNINGLGASGWQQLRAGGFSGLTNAASMRSLALGGDFADEIDAVESQITRGDRILTYDGRLVFFYLDQVDIQRPQSCAQLPGHRLFVLLEDDEIRKQFGTRASPAFWEACKNATLTKVAERPGAFAVFVNGVANPAAGECGVTPPPDQGLAIEFGRMRTAAAAEALQRHVAALGFIQAKVEQLGCSLYRVVETGVPNKAVGQSIIAEAKSAGVSVKLVGG